MQWDTKTYGPVYLSAEWRYLLMMNFEVPQEILLPHLPHGTELDLHEGRCMASIVGFRFLNTRLKGFAIPFHQHFNEVNLRFYIKYKSGNEWRRGVAFLKEIVEKRAVAYTARFCYGENYVYMPMRHDIQHVTMKGVPAAERLSLRYDWFWNERWHHISAQAQGGPRRELLEGSEERFIAEHYWGYTTRGKRTSEYRVAHPTWSYWPVAEYSWACDVAGIYGQDFVESLSQPPCSVFIADGSEVCVHDGHVVVEG